MQTNTKAKAAKANAKSAIKAKSVIVTPEANNVPATETRAKPVREIHGITPTYSGVSQSFNKAKSRTRIQIEAFNQQPNIIFTARGNAFLHDLKAKYGKASFKRLDLDAGNLNRSIRAGHIQHVSGDPVSDTCTFKLTQKALDTKYI